MELAETRGIKGMDSNKGQGKIQESRVYYAEETFTRARELFRFKAITRNIVQSALMKMDDITAEEMQREKPSPSLIEKYYQLQHYLDYLDRFCEGEV
jgi:hypothetical protein